MSYKIDKVELKKYHNRAAWVPDMIVEHIADGTYAGTIAWFKNPGVQTSSHFLVAQNGRITQFLPLEVGSWCNGTQYSVPSGKNYYGRSTNRLVKERKVNANLYTISIEYEGYYAKTKGKLTPEQLTAAIWLHKHIISEVQRIYGKTIPVDREHIVGHYEITPREKPSCPGELFPWNTLMAALQSTAKTAEPTTTGKLYRVQVGAFAQKANAEKLAAELASKGYKTYIVN